MKGFLLDENLPRRLRFQSSLPVSPVRDLGAFLSDLEIWDHAKKHDLCIVTKDADFSDLILLSEPPPRVIHLRFGNVRRKAFHDFLARIWYRLEILSLEYKLIVFIWITWR